MKEYQIRVFALKIKRGNHRSLSIRFKRLRSYGMALMELIEKAVEPSISMPNYDFA